MPLTTAYGVRFGRCPVTGACRMQASGFGGYRFGGSMHDGTGPAGRTPDVQVAADVVAALRRGIPARVGLNRDGVVGVGTVWHYRPSVRTGTNVDTVVKYDGVHNRTLAVLPLHTEAGREAARRDVLAAIRQDAFRIIAFSDFYADRGFTTLHPHNIHYTVPVSRRLRHVPMDQLTCQLDQRRTYDPFAMQY